VITLIDTYEAGTAVSTEIVRSGSQFHSEGLSTAPEIRFSRFNITISISAINLGDDTFLFLKERPTGRINAEDWMIHIEKWNVSVSRTEINEVAPKIARKFLYLWNRSVNMELLEDEKKDWEKIYPLVDYSAFCLDHQPSLYTEGRILDKSTSRVEWINGEKETLTEFYNNFRILEDGDVFGAFIKRNKENKVSIISDVRPLELQ